MRGEEVVKLLIKWLCKTADGGGFTKWWIPQQYFCYIKNFINIQYARSTSWKVAVKLMYKCSVLNALKFQMTATLKILQSFSWELESVNELRRSRDSIQVRWDSSYVETKNFCHWATVLGLVLWWLGVSWAACFALTKGLVVQEVLILIHSKNKATPHTTCLWKCNSIEIATLGN